MSKRSHATQVGETITEIAALDARLPSLQFSLRRAKNGEASIGDTMFIESCARLMRAASAHLSIAADMAKAITAEKQANRTITVRELFATEDGAVEAEAAFETTESELRAEGALPHSLDIFDDIEIPYSAFARSIGAKTIWVQPIGGGVSYFAEV